jgi:hypothetical protein
LVEKLSNAVTADTTGKVLSTISQGIRETARLSSTSTQIETSNKQKKAIIA